jgi:hypothetical protein
MWLVDRRGPEARLPTARRIVASAGDDAELKALADELQADAIQHDACMAPMDMKKRHFATYSATRSRTADGKARR